VYLGALSSIVAYFFAYKLLIISTLKASRAFVISNVATANISYSRVNF